MRCYTLRLRTFHRTRWLKPIKRQRSDKHPEFLLSHLSLSVDSLPSHASSQFVSVLSGKPMCHDHDHDHLLPVYLYVGMATPRVLGGAILGVLITFMRPFRTQTPSEVRPYFANRNALVQPRYL